MVALWETSPFGNAAFSLHEASHTSKCFQGFFAAAFFKRPNKLELLNRGWPTAYGASDVFGWQTKLNELVSIVASGRRRTFTWKVPCGEYETKWKSCDENVMKTKNIFQMKINYTWPNLNDIKCELNSRDLTVIDIMCHNSSTTDPRSIPDLFTLTYNPRHPPAIQQKSWRHP